MNLSTEDNLPYAVSFFSILIAPSIVGAVDVGAAVVVATSNEQSGPPQPKLQKQRFVFVHTWEIHVIRENILLGKIVELYNYVFILPSPTDTTFH